MQLWQREDFPGFKWDNNKLKDLSNENYYLYGQLITTAEGNILVGITRDIIMQIAKNINNKDLGANIGPITEQIKNKYTQISHGLEQNYINFLSYVDKISEFS